MEQISGIASFPFIAGLHSIIETIKLLGAVPDSI
jgi:hypothetical protein